MISHRTPDKAADMARAQGVGALALLDADVVDLVAGEGEDVAAAVADVVAGALDR